jgi:hypothetical protein
MLPSPVRAMRLQDHRAFTLIEPLVEPGNNRPVLRDSVDRFSNLRAVHAGPGCVCI